MVLTSAGLVWPPLVVSGAAYALCFEGVGGWGVGVVLIEWPRRLSHPLTGPKLGALGLERQDMNPDIFRRYVEIVGGRG